MSVASSCFSQEPANTYAQFTLAYASGTIFKGYATSKGAPSAIAVAQSIRCYNSGSYQYITTFGRKSSKCGDCSWQWRWRRYRGTTPHWQCASPQHQKQKTEFSFHCSRSNAILCGFCPDHLVSTNYHHPTFTNGNTQHSLRWRYRWINGIQAPDEKSRLLLAVWNILREKIRTIITRNA